MGVLGRTLGAFGNWGTPEMGGFSGCFCLTPTKRGPKQETAIFIRMSHGSHATLAARPESLHRAGLILGPVTFVWRGGGGCADRKIEGLVV